jgi:hypothetical protein
MAMVKTFWLSMHVPYACRQSGVCCSSGWAIAVEHTRTAAIGMLRGDGSWLLPAPGASPEVAGILALANGGHCVFHRQGCEIQRAYGHAALPSACQHFPREVLIDGRGVFVTLSHYCPTAVDLLFEHVGSVDIVEGPPALPTGAPEGLDARAVLPPLLTEGVLMDMEGCAAWEAHMVRLLTGDDATTAEDKLARLAIDLAKVQQWRPGIRSLAAEISRLQTRVSPGGSNSRRRNDVDIAAGSGSSQGSADLIIGRYLAARAFGSWMAYQGGGIAAVLGHLRFALSLLRERLARLPLKEAIRGTDLQTLHLMSRDALVAQARSNS